MLEIDEIMPLYLCDKNGCDDSSKEFGCGDCAHTTNELLAKNKESIDILNRFRDAFNCIVDDYGRLQVWEKENK